MVQILEICLRHNHPSANLQSNWQERNMLKSEPISRTVCPHRCELAASGAPPLLLPRTTIHTACMRPLFIRRPLSCRCCEALRT